MRGIAVTTEGRGHLTTHGAASAGHWLHTVNDIVHDLSAGAWPGTAVALWLIRRRAESSLPPGTLTPVLPALSSAFIVMFAALAVLVLTGLARVSYRHLVSRTLVRTALIKHGVFTVVFILATVLAVASLQP